MRTGFTLTLWMRTFCLWRVSRTKQKLENLNHTLGERELRRMWATNCVYTHTHIRRIGGGTLPNWLQFVVVMLPLLLCVTFIVTKLCMCAGFAAIDIWRQLRALVWATWWATHHHHADGFRLDMRIDAARGPYGHAGRMAIRNLMSHLLFKIEHSDDASSSGNWCARCRCRGFVFAQGTQHFMHYSHKVGKDN